MASDKDIAEKIITHQLNLARLEAGLRNKVLLLIKKMQAELTVKLNSQTLTEIGKADVNRLLKQAGEVIDGYYSQAAGVVDMPELAINTARATSMAMEAVMAVSMPTDKFLISLAGNVLIEGAPSAAWWAKQSADMQFKFSGAVRQGLIAAETNQQIVRRVVEAIGVSRRNAAALVQTSVAAVASDARMAVYKENAELIAAYVRLETLDGRTCLAAGSKVATPEGEKNIEDFMVGDLVIGGSGAARCVRGVMKSKKRQMARVKLSNGKTIVCTEDHRFLTGNREWKTAKDLLSGDIMRERL